MKPSLLPPSLTLSLSSSTPLPSLSLSLSGKLDQKVSVALSEAALPSPSPRRQLHPAGLTDTDVADARRLGGETPTGLSASSCFRTVSMQLSPGSVRGGGRRGVGEEGASGEFLSEGVCVRVRVCGCADGGVKSHPSRQTRRVFVRRISPPLCSFCLWEGGRERARARPPPLPQHPICGQAAAALQSARSSVERETPPLPLYPRKSIAVAGPDKPDY